MSDLAPVKLPIKSDTGRTPLAFDAIHHRALEAAPDWPLAEGVRKEYGGPCDLVLVAVEPGCGQQVAEFLADELTVTEVAP